MRFERRATPVQRLSLAPLIDVVFLLLIFFMLTSSFLETQAIEFDLPASATAEATRPTVLVVSVSREGGFGIDGRPLETPAFKKELAARLGSDGPGVLVLSDREVSVERVVAAMDMVRQAGGREVSLATRPTN